MSGAKAPVLRIGIEAHVVGKRPSGNGRVVANLIRGIRGISRHHLFVYFTDPEVASAWRRQGDDRLTVRTVRGRNPLIRIPFSLPYLAARDRLDVFLAHDNRPPFAPCPVVTLLHDVAFARHPEFFSRYERTWMNRTIPFSIRRSAGILTVSNFTANEIAELYGIARERISVAWNGVDRLFFDPPTHPSPLDPPFFLAVGNLQPRKNLATVIEALRLLLERDPDRAERLVIVGQKQYRAEPLLVATRDLRRAGRVVFTGYLPDEQIRALMRAATAFVYPSVYEGYGLPPIEAMAAGAPAIVSDIAVTRELIGDAAIRVDATDASAWADAMWRVAVDPAFREALATRGQRHAAGFTWEASAIAALGALERAARGSGRML